MGICYKERRTQRLMALAEPASRIATGAVKTNL